MIHAIRGELGGEEGRGEMGRWFGGSFCEGIVRGLHVFWFEWIWVV